MAHRRKISHIVRRIAQLHRRQRTLIPMRESQSFSKLGASRLQHQLAERDRIRHARKASTNLCIENILRLAIDMTDCRLDILSAGMNDLLNGIVADQLPERP